MPVNLDYLSLRLIRHFMPRAWVHFLLRYNLIIQPGFETRAPKETVTRYLKTLENTGRSIQGQRILNFGYGGNYALACGLLQAGASHVTLIDKFANPDDRRNRKLLPEYEQYLIRKDGQVIPCLEFIDLLEGDIHDAAISVDGNFRLLEVGCADTPASAIIEQNNGIAPFDIVLSSSVFEHLDDVGSITRSLAALTRPDGLQLHFIDLRDHYFKYPFEMLTYSEKTWQRWFNPSSNLNRYRLLDYQRTFEEYFTDVQMTVLERDLVEFNKAANRIRPEFLSGNAEIDSVTLIMALVVGPKNPSMVSTAVNYKNSTSNPV